MLARRAALLLALALVALLASACGDSATKPGLDAFLPAIPPPTGEAQQAFAGVITDANAAQELLGGTAAQGQGGDYFLRNDRIRVVIGRPGREIAPQPYGGNILDADLVRAPGDPYYQHPDSTRPGNDRLGEIGVVYVTGRTFDFTDPEVLADGAGGGVAAIRFRGKDALNDFINLNGMGLVPIPPALVADTPVAVDAAVTYVLEPGSDAVRVLYTVHNTGATPIKQPFGLLADSGSEVELYVPGGQFGGVSTSNLANLKGPAPYAVLTGPGVAYGMVPRLGDALAPVHGAFSVEGVVILLFNSTELTDLFDDTKYALDLPPGQAVTFEVELYVGRDAAAVEALIRTRRALPAGTVSGRVLEADGATPAPGARVFLFKTATGALDAAAVDVAYAVSDAAGAYTLTAEPGSYVVVAQTSRASRSAPRPVTLSAAGGAAQDVTLSPVARIHYTVVDAGGAAVPARLAVVGADPTPADARLGDTEDTADGVVDQVDTLTGSSEDATAPARVLEVAPGGPYRLIATRGPEWDAATQVIQPVAGANGPYTLTLHHVVDTTGYVGCDFHQHAINSPDSPVALAARVTMNVADGLELMAATDHDFITDYTPVIERLGATELIGSVIGVEATPFDYGHFNFYPLTPDPAARNRGAIDWGGGDGPGLAPGQLMQAYRDQRDAAVLQVNHPRSRSATGGFQANFDRAHLDFDFAGRSFGGVARKQPIDNATLRLPEDQSVFPGDLFNVLEVWNGLGAQDTNDDGVREDPATDRVLKDWFNFLSFGFAPVGVANSDTHKTLRDRALPRTFVRVPADGPAAIAGGLTPAVVATLRRQGPFPGDVVMSNGPMIKVAVGGDAATGIGATVTPAAGVVSLAIEVSAPPWAPVDTLELFAGASFDGGGNVLGALTPTVCFTARTGRAANDTCDAAPLGGARPLVVATETADGGTRWVARVTLDLPVADVPRREGGRGQDLWLVVRAYGSSGIFPLVFTGDVVAPEVIAALAGGSDDEVRAALRGRGPFALAITNPIFVDVDGGGYTAPFAP
ncbi:MAG TPA: carboxypeptidase regulatory-like domain-containing protein [Polyangia bacterium]|jgi:hypothetical protein